MDLKLELFGQSKPCSLLHNCFQTSLMRLVLLRARLWWSRHSSSSRHRNVRQSVLTYHNRNSMSICTERLAFKFQRLGRRSNSLKDLPLLKWVGHKVFLNNIIELSRGVQGKHIWISALSAMRQCCSSKGEAGAQHMQICRQRATDGACTPVASLPLQEVSHAPGRCPADALKRWDQTLTMANSS